MGFSIKKALKTAARLNPATASVMLAQDVGRIIQGESVKDVYNPFSSSKDNKNDPYAGMPLNLANFLKMTKEGELLGEKKAEEYLGGAPKERLEQMKERESRGLTAAEYQPLETRYRTATRALRGAQAGAGVRGATAYQAQAGLAGQMSQAKAQLNAQLMEQAYQNRLAEERRQEQVRLSLPLAYGSLYGGQAAAGMQAEIASRPTPQPKRGILGELFGGLF